MPRISKPKAAAKKPAASAERKQGKQCVCCYPQDSFHPLSEYYSSTSPLHADGLAPICKRCVVKNSFDYKSGRIDMEGFLAVLRLMDRPYLPDVLKMASKDFDEVYDLSKVTERTRLENRDQIVSMYFKRLLASPTYRKYRYADGQQSEALQAQPAVPVRKKTVDDSVRQFWGPGFTDADYQCLQHEFDEWAEGRPFVREDKAQQEIVKNLCYGRLQIIHATANGENTGAMVNSFNQSLSTGNLKPVEKAAADDKPLGVVIRDIVQYCPADFFKDKSIHNDVDDIEKYMRNVIGRVVNNTMNGARDDDPEYSVSADDE